MREGSSFLRLRGEPTFAGDLSKQQKSSLGLGQYRGRKCERGHHFEARERPRQARRRKEEDGRRKDGTRSLKREPTHQRMVGNIGVYIDFKYFFLDFLFFLKWIFAVFLMDFKFWGAAPGGFFENPTTFGISGLKIKENFGKVSNIFEKL